jgi:hypothetical protein
MAVILIYLPHEALHGDLFAYRLQWAGLPPCVEIGRQDSTTHFLLIYCFWVFGRRGSGPDLITELSVLHHLSVANP